MMTQNTLTMTSKGQITIPAKVRQSLNVETGDQVEFVQLEPGQYLFVAANRTVTELKGMKSSGNLEQGFHLGSDVQHHVRRYDGLLLRLTHFPIQGFDLI
jgi:AbrB family looped-hinge helix DNA binding protein